MNLNGATLPAGLQLDPVSGVISGTLQAQPAGEKTISGLLASVTNAGVQSTSVANLSMDLQIPTGSFYNWVDVATSAPLRIVPVITVSSPLPLVNPSYRYAARAGDCNLPPGVMLDPATGVLSGTPADIGVFSCSVDVTITNNGIQWTQGTFFSLILR